MASWFQIAFIWWTLCLIAGLCPRAYHNDLRTSAVYQYNALGRSSREIAETNGPSQRTVQRWLSRYERYGTVLPDPALFGEFRGRPRTISPHDFNLIVDIITEDCTRYIDEIQVLLYFRGGSWLSISTVQRWIRRLGFTRQRLFHFAHEALMGTVWEYYDFLYNQQFDMSRLVFIDESHSNDRTMERMYGNSMRGTIPVFDYHMVRGQRYTISVAVNARGIVDYCVFRGSCTGHLLMEWLLRSLCLALDEDSILVMDNAAIHHYEPVMLLLGYLDIPVIFLPPYCCFLNPCEHVFASVKAAIRRYREEMYEDPAGTLAAILRNLRNYNVRGLMRRMGYHRVCR